MQKIKFTSSAGEIEFTDNETQQYDGKWVPFQLIAFDPNSQGVSRTAVTCLDMDGQHVVDERLNPKSIGVTVRFDGRGYQNAVTGNSRKSGGDNAMYYFRRLILKHFPLKEVGELEYTNDRGTYYINCCMTEYPAIERQCGTMCQITFYLTADYPYWHKKVSGNVYTAKFDDPAAVMVNCNGDVASPIIGTITCVSAIEGNETGVFFKLYQYEGGSSQMAFVKNLEVGQKIVFNTGLNNEVYVKLIDADGTESYANNYVDYRNSDLLKNNVGETKWRLKIYGTAGELTIQMQYQNLFVAV